MELNNFKDDYIEIMSKFSTLRAEILIEDLRERLAEAYKQFICRRFNASINCLTSVSDRLPPGELNNDIKFIIEKLRKLNNG